MRAGVASLVTGLLIFAPIGATRTAPGAVGKSAVSSTAPEERDLERAPRADYWVSEWRRRWRVEHRANLQRARTIRRLRRVLREDGTVREAIGLAAVTYSVDGSMLLRKATCESGLNPRARNLSSSASGLLQFLPSTWATTPYAGFSVWSPYANALAAGWMHKVGRGGEWVCR